MMSKRKKSVGDVMGDVLDNNVDKSTSTSVSQQVNISNPSDYLASDKMRSTYYFLPSTVDELEDTTTKLKSFVGRVLGREKRRFVSRSLLVERAVKLMLEDYEQNGADSAIAKDLMRLR